MNIKSRFTAIFAISLAAMIAMPLVFYWVTTGEYYGRKIDQVAPDFTLIDTQDQLHSLSQHKGKFTFGAVLDN